MKANPFSDIFDLLLLSSLFWGGGGGGGGGGGAEKDFSFFGQEADVNNNQAISTPNIFS